MKKQPKEDCCKGCLKGNPGGNVNCRAKMMVTAMAKAQKLPLKNDKNNRL